MDYDVHPFAEVERAPARSSSVRPTPEGAQDDFQVQSKERNTESEDAAEATGRTAAACAIGAPVRPEITGFSRAMLRLNKRNPNTHAPRSR